MSGEERVPGLISDGDRPDHECKVRSRSRPTLRITGRRRAKRDGYPRATLLGGPVHAVVRRPPAKNHGFESFHCRPSLPLYRSSIRRASVACSLAMALGTTCPRTPRRLRLSGDLRCAAPARLPLHGESAFDGEKVLSAPAVASLSVPRFLPQPRTLRSGTTTRPRLPRVSVSASVMHRLPASRSVLMSQQRLASRASNYQAVCSARSPRTTTGPFAADATTGSATTACIPATLLLPALPQDAERRG